MRRLLALSVVALAASMGCRICSSPYDYCGPVVESGCMEPNGRGGCYGSGGGSCPCCNHGSGEVAEEQTSGMPVEGETTEDESMDGAPIMNGGQMQGAPMNGGQMQNGAQMNGGQMQSAPMNGPSYQQNSPWMNGQPMMPSGGQQGTPTPAPNPAPNGYNPAAWRQSSQTMQYR